MQHCSVWETGTCFVKLRKLQLFCCSKELQAHPLPEQNELAWREEEFLDLLRALSVWAKWSSDAIRPHSRKDAALCLSHSKKYSTQEYIHRRGCQFSVWYFVTSTVYIRIQIQNVCLYKTRHHKVYASLTNKSPPYFFPCINCFLVLHHNNIPQGVREIQPWLGSLLMTHPNHPHIYMLFS